MPLTDIWTDIAWEGIAKEGNVTFKKGKKPEKLIQRCISLVTKKATWCWTVSSGRGPRPPWHRRWAVAISGSSWGSTPIRTAIPV